MTTGQIGVLSGVGFALFFVAIWSLVLGLTARVAGWWRLAQRYADTSLFSGETIRFATAQFGLASYSGMLVVGASDMGLYLATIRIFRPFHHPLFIPWNEIDVRLPEGLIRRAQLRFPAELRVRVTLYGRAVDQVRPYVRR
jgi:hypothetical protein